MRIRRRPCTCRQPRIRRRTHRRRARTGRGPLMWRRCRLELHPRPRRRRGLRERPPVSAGVAPPDRCGAGTARHHHLCAAPRRDAVHRRRRRSVACARRAAAARAVGRGARRPDRRHRPVSEATPSAAPRGWCWPSRCRCTPGRRSPWWYAATSMSSPWTCSAAPTRWRSAARSRSAAAAPFTINWCWTPRSSCGDCNCMRRRRPPRATWS